MSDEEQPDNYSPRRGKTSTSLVVIQERIEDRKRKEILDRRPDDRISDDTWITLQECGESAAERLKELLDSPAFPKRRLTEQIKLMEIAFNRAYGTADGGVKRTATNLKSLPIPKGNATRPEIAQLGNSLARLAKRAQFPELRKRDSPDEDEDEDEDLNGQADE